MPDWDLARKIRSVSPTWVLRTFRIWNLASVYFLPLVVLCSVIKLCLPKLTSVFPAIWPFIPAHTSSIDVALSSTQLSAAVIITTASMSMLPFFLSEL